MADPLSIASILLQVGSVIKTLYDYGKKANEAQTQILSLCSELCALKSILADLQSAYEDASVAAPSKEFQKMLSMTYDILDGLAKRLDAKPTARQRALQSLRFPLEESTVKETMARLERLKSWFLLAMMTEQHSASTSLQRNVQELSGIIKHDVAKRGRLEDELVAEKLRVFLAPTSPEVYHRKACSNWIDTGSSSWFLDGPVQRWLQNKDSEDKARVKILTGKSGAGKTTLMSQAMERCKQYAELNEGMYYAHFYCSFNDASSQEPRNIIGSWYVQLSLQCEDMLQQLEPAPRDAETDSLIDKLLDSMLELKGTVFLILDALNETPESKKLLQAISRLTSGLADVRCLISTTPMSLVSMVKHDTIEMAQELVAIDIAAYIRAKHAEQPVLQAVPEQELIEALAPRADGMFRWVDVQMRILSEQLTPKLLRRALKDLPGSLHETYAAILAQIPRSEISFVRTALMWLSFSRRLLKLDELCEAVVVEEGDRTIDDSCRIHPRQRLIELCRGLVAWDKPSDTVTLAHSSVRAYLTSEDIQTSAGAAFALDAESAQRHFFRICLTYLQFKDFSVGYCELSETQRLQRTFPLLDYAVTQWPLHVKAVQDQLGESDLKLIDSFILTQKSKDQSSNFNFWINCLVVTGKTRKAVILAAEPLYFLASFGLDVCVERLLEKGLVSKMQKQGCWHIDHKCGRVWSTALNVACARGTVRTVERLLEAGADPNSETSRHKSCLSVAAGRRRVDVVELLKRYGVTVTAKDVPLLNALDGGPTRSENVVSYEQNQTN